jgi:hypothetical protein
LTRRRLLLFALVTLVTCLGLFGLASANDTQQPAAPRRIGVLTIPGSVLLRADEVIW